MGILKLTSRDAVLEAIEEYDQDEQAFLDKYGFQRAKSYEMIHDGRRYASKAIAGVAFGIQFPSLGPMPNGTFGGGKRQAGAALAKLGFYVVGVSKGKPPAGVSAPRNDPWTRDELILALDVYIRNGRKVLAKNHREVIELSTVLNKLPIHTARNGKFRNENGVTMKLANFRFIDPQGSTGLAGGAKAEKLIWNEFAHDPPHLRRVAEAIRKNIDSPEVTEPYLMDPPDADEEFPEGAVLERMHRSRERNNKLVVEKKRRAGAKPACEACGFVFHDHYGARGGDYIECHHEKPVSELIAGEGTKLKDLRLVCANCHRVLHRIRPWITVAELREILRARVDGGQEGDRGR